MSEFKIKCENENCGKTHDVDLDYEEADREERQMGAEITYHGECEFTCECGQDIEISRTFWEYPEGSISDDDDIQVKGGELL